MKKYIHYGHKMFDCSKFNKISNDPYFTKPAGGLWASPVDTEMGWEDWCERENFRECEIDNSFVFSLAPHAKVLYVDDIEVLKVLPKQGKRHDIWVPLDFERLMVEGWDAVEVSLSSDPRLYWSLYGWDCDSIVIMNPDVVLEVTECLK